MGIVYNFLKLQQSVLNWWQLNFGCIQNFTPLQPHLLYVIGVPSYVFIYCVAMNIDL